MIWVFDNRGIIGTILDVLWVLDGFTPLRIHQLPLIRKKLARFRRIIGLRLVIIEHLLEGHDIVLGFIWPMSDIDLYVKNADYLLSFEQPLLLWIPPFRYQSDLGHLISRFE